MLGREVDLDIAPLVGAEVVSGSTRLKAGTATKMILNMISTGAMVLIGKTLGNRMVDLQPTNEKLRIRSRRILRELAGVDDVRPAQILEACEGRLKPALVVALADVDPDSAPPLLEKHGGQVRSAIRAAGGREPALTHSASRKPVRLLGVDGGGTATKVWLAEPGCRVLGRGAAGPSNAKAVGLEAAHLALDSAIRAAFDDAGLAPAPVDAACLGLAGFDRPDDRKILTRWVDEGRWADRHLLVNDGDLVVAAGTPEGWGVGVIAGTGSIAVGRAPDGRTARAGGWGHLIGDEGSAYCVVLEALRLVAHRADGREPRPSGPDPLTKRLCAALGVAEASQIVTALYAPEFDRARIASLAPEVLAACAEVPEDAERLLLPAGAALADTVAAVARALGWPSGFLPLATAGGFLLSAATVRQELIDGLTRRGYQVGVTPVPDPVRGAVILAERTFAGARY